jgi:hypothetical protein
MEKKFKKAKSPWDETITWGAMSVRQNGNETNMPELSF